MKLERHSKIVELIGKYDIETQEELAAYLQKEGFQVTQATVSRDIRELRLTKVQTGKGRQKYSLAQNILVIRTVSGMAMAVGAAIDSLNFPEVVGCIAGDDTVMCAIRTLDDTIVLMDKIRKLIE